MTDYHEPPEELSQETRNFTRALHSLREEIEAIDWYHQRIQASEDDSLRRILVHNRNEEMEHASMALEWLRRHMEGWDERLRTYLFTEGEISEIEVESSGRPGEDDGSAQDEAQDLGIGNLSK